MTNPDNEVPAPGDSGTSGTQTVGTTVAPVEKPQLTALKLDHEFEGLASVNSKALGGFGASALTLVGRMVQSEREDAKTTIARLEEKLDKAQAEVTELKVEKRGLERDLASMRVTRRWGYLIGVVGTTIAGIGVSELKQNPGTGWPFLICGVVLIAIGALLRPKGGGS